MKLSEDNDDVYTEEEFEETDQKEIHGPLGAMKKGCMRKKGIH